MSVDVIVHQVVGGEGLSSLARDHRARTARLGRAPMPGELLYDPQSKEMGHVLQVAHARDGTVHAFVVPAQVPPYVAEAFGIAYGGVPSLTNFEGRTIGELIAFLAQYPAGEEVTFNDKQILVAKSKRDMVVLRLDDPGDG